MVDSYKPNEKYIHRYTLKTLNPCVPDLSTSTTELSSVSITATKTSTNNLLATWKNQRPITTYTNSISPGVQSTKQSHISTRANVANSEVVDSSDLPLPAVIVPVVLLIVGIAAGAVLWKWKRYLLCNMQFYYISPIEPFQSYAERPQHNVIMLYNSPQLYIQGLTDFVEQIREELLLHILCKILVRNDQQIKQKHKSK